ncbi:MAG: DUF11 domain-containing protein [Chitinophaga sp.]|uniref:DUF7927 domain-containing protein n=1 Tax=Chitinophaga sp. TaxID=1869181 RepID=UPI001B0532FA|nr:gliding motility-associated C-terminal domain-containing protein [Chitinophaga sp.]MBO9727266.1 DUF11 domain-containing protein [Chitinophaga sp.]
MVSKFTVSSFTSKWQRQLAAIDSVIRMNYGRLLVIFFLFLSVNPANAQQCNGSLGDPVFKETFGQAPSATKPTLGGPLPAGITTYTYYSPGVGGRPTGPYPGQYTISNTTRGYNNTYFVDRPDHTTTNGTGYCMVVDAEAKPGQFYQRTITGLCAGTTFEFSAWIMNINPQNGVSQPSLRFDILDANNPNGAPITSVSTGTVPFQSPGTWVRQAGVFQMPSTTNAVILRIISNTPSSNGNDLALDDIAFAACGPPITFLQAPGVVCAGGNTSLSVSLPAGSYSTYFFQLQKRPLGTTDWNNEGSIINNGATNQYTFPVTNAQAGFEYRVVAAGGSAEINNLNCRVVSNPIELKVIDYTVAITGQQPICYNTATQLSAVVTPKAGTGTPTTGYIYQWETSANGTTGWTIVPGQVTATLNTGALTATRYYRVTATVNGCQGDGVSRPFVVNVTPNITATLSAVANVCQGSLVMSLPYTINSGSADRYSVTSSDMPGFVAVNNASLSGSPLAIAIPGNAPAGTYHFNITFSNSTSGCNSVAYPFTLVIDAPSSIASAGTNQELCAVTSATLGGNIAVNGTGTWSQINGPNTVVFANINDPSTTVSGLVPGTYIFNWRIANGTCAASNSRVQVVVDQAPTVANAGPDQLQFNSGVFTMAANTPAVGTGKWTIVSGTANIVNTSDPHTIVTIAANTTATLAWTITNGNCPPSEDQVVITYTHQPDIRINKMVLNSGPYLAGQDLTYQVVVSNAGRSDAASVTVKDAIPADFVATNITYTTSGTAQILTNSSTNTQIDLTAKIPASSSVIFTIEGNIKSSFEGDLTNTATATSPDIADPAGISSMVTIPVARQPFFSAVKTAPASTVAGEQLQFNITVDNTGLGDAVGAVITDVISSKLTNVSWTAFATGGVVITGGATGTGNNIRVVANMPGGTEDTGKVYITVTGTVDAAATGTIINVATVTPSEPAGNAVNSNTTNTLITSSPGLLVNKERTSSVIAIAGQRIDYVLTLVNNGPSNAVGTVITDTVPAMIQNVTWTTTIQGSAAVTAGASGSGNMIRVTGNIPAGGTNRILVKVSGTVSPDYAGTILNRVTATPAEPGVPPVSDDDIATVEKNVKFDITKDGPATGVAGEPITYTVDVKNDGPSNATNTEIRDIVSSSLVNVSWNATVVSGTAVIKSGATGNVNSVDVIADMNAGSTIRIIITGTILPATVNPIKNTAQVIPVEPNTPPVTSNEIITEITQRSALAITKSGPDTASAGNTITYIINASNNGPSIARNVVITDIVPATLQGVTWAAVVHGNAVIHGTPGGTGNNISLSADIGVGAANYIAITVKGTIDPAFSGQINNKAVITPAPGTGTADSAVKITTVNRLPKLAITKTAVDFMVAGDSLTFTIQVTNLSTSNAQNLVVTDVIPPSLSGVHWSATAAGAATISGASSGTGNNISLTGSIPAGSGNMLTITVTGKTDPSLDGFINNIATATPSESVPPVSANKTVRVRRIPKLTISKSGPATLNAGEEIVYTIAVNNIGPSDAQNLVIDDIVPAMVQNVTWTTATTGAATITRGAVGTGSDVNLAADIPGGGNNGILIFVKGTVDPSFSGTFSNSAVYQPSEPGATPGSSNVVVTTVSQQPNVKIIKSGPAKANAGDVITYNLRVTNLGPSNSMNTVITDQLPALLRNVSWTAVASGGAVINTGATGTGNALSVEADVPAKTGVVNISITATIPPSTPAGSMQNFAVATPSAPGIPPVNSDTVVTTIQQKSALLITKIGPSTARAGETINYGIKVVNTGPSDAIGVVIADTIPAAVDNPSWGATTGGGAVITSGAGGTGNLLQIIANIPAGETNYINVQVDGTINGDFTGTLVNKAQAAIPGNPPVTSAATTQVTRQAVLQVRKSGPANAAAGSPIQYTVEVSNNGPSNATNVTIKDAIPVGIVNATWVATGMNGAVITSGNTGTGNIQLQANIPATSLAAVHIIVKGQVDPGFTGVTITNTAIALNDPSITPVGDTATVVTSTYRQANLGIVKSGPANGAAGEPMQYTLLIRNQGPSNAIGLRVQDALPPGLLNATWTTSSTGNVQNISPASGNGNVDLTADIPADSSTLLVTINGIVSPALVNGTTLNNTATVGFPVGSNIVDPNLADNTSTVATVIDNDPIVRIGKTGPAITHVLDPITYRIVVSNGGSGNITNALINDMVPGAVTVTSWTATATGTATVTGAASGNTNNISTTGDIPVGANNTIVIVIQGTVNNTAGNTITNTATVTAGANKQSSVTTSVDRSLDVSIIKNGPQQVLAGEPITYTLQIFNAGPQRANNLVITDVLPAAITNVTWTAIATGDASVLDSVRIDSSGNIELPAQLGPGAANFITITIRGTVSGNTTAGTITNTATAIATGVTDYNPSNNTSSVTTTVGVATGVQVHKSGPSQAVGGNAITYNIIVTNSGPSDATGVNIVDLVPAAVTNVSWQAAVNGSATVTGPFSGTGNSISTTATIPGGVGNNITIAVTGTVDNDFAGTILNKVNVSGTGIPAVSDSVNTVVTRETGLQLRKDGPVTITAGDKVTYVITLGNTGPGYARNMQVTDTIDARIQQPTWTTQTTNGAVVNSGASGSGALLAVNADIPPAANALVTITVTGTLSAGASGTLSNTATVTPPDSTYPPVVTPPVITPIEQHPMLAITKNGPGSLHAGEMIHYTLQVSNNGISDATNAQITDQVPATISQVQWSVQNITGGAVVTAGNSGTGNQVQVTANMPAGATILVQVTGKVDSSFAGTITNTGIVIPAEPGNTPDSSGIQTQVTLQPSVNITKSGPATLQSGENISYTIVATNNGPSTAVNADIHDAVPTAIKQVTWTATAAGKATINGTSSGSGNVVDLLASIPPGAGNSITIQVNGTVDPAFRDTLKNKAIITPAEPGALPDTSELVQTVVTGNPILSITKAGPATAIAGQNISYTITVSNSGKSDAVNLAITDTVPASIVDVQWQAVAEGVATINGVASGNGNSINLHGNIAAGNANTIVITVTGRVLPATTGTIVNTATVTPAEPGAASAQSSASTTLNIVSLLNISKTGPAIMTRGEEATYVINVINPGPSKATNVDITDIIPAVLTNVTWTATPVRTALITAGATGTGNNVKVTADIPAIDTSGIMIVVHGIVAQNAPAGTVTNIAHAVISNQGGKDFPSMPVISKIVSAADLSIVKTGPSSVYEGSQVTYVLTVNNQNGPSDANGATVSDMLPAGFTNAAISVQSSSGGAGNIQTSITGNTATATLGTFPVGAQVVLQITGIATTPGTLSNVAVVNTPTGMPDTDSSNNTSTTVVTTVQEKSALKIVKAVTPATGPYEVGQTITYTITATNNGTVAVNPVVTNDQLPVDTLVSDPTYNAPPRGTVNYNATQRILQWNIGLLNAGETLSWDYQVTIKGPGSVQNAVVITGPPDVSTPDTSVVIIPVPKNTDLKITKTGTDTVFEGSKVTYLLTVDNAGPLAANGATVNDVLPAGLTQTAISVQSSSGGAGNIQSSITGNTATATLGTFPVGAQVVLQITGTATTPGTLSNVAVVNTPAGLPDKDSSNNTSSTVVTTVQAKAALKVVKAVSPVTGPYEIGQTLTYTITATNTGTTVVNPVVTTDQLPADTLVSDPTYNAPPKGSVNYNAAQRILQWTIGALNGGETTSWSYQVTIKGPGNVQNSVVITGPPDVSTPDTSVVIIPVPKNTDLKITKTGTDTVFEGGKVTYVLTVDNAGPLAANGATVNDVLPAGLTQTAISVQTSSGGAGNIQSSITGNTATATLGTFPVGAQVVLQITGTATTPGTLSNVAVVNTPAGLPDKDSSNNTSSTVVTTVQAKSALKIVKAVSPATGPYNVGQTLTYTITATNTGTTVVDPVVATDQLPAATLVSDPTYSAPPKGSVNYNATQRILQWNIGALNGGETTSWSYQVTIKGPGSVQNAVVITGPPDVSTPDTSIVIVPVEKNTDLKITKAGPATVFEGGKVTYVLTVDNAGPLAADGATVNDVLPAGLTQTAISVQTSSGGAGNIQSSITGNTATATLGTFPAGAQVVLQITGNAPASGTLSNVAVVNTPAGLPDIDSSNNTSSTVVTTIEGKSALKVVKTISPATGPYSVGQQLTYTITATNTGTAAVNPVITTDQLPAASLVSDPTYNAPPKGSVTYDSRQRILQWNIGAVNGGETVVWSYQVTILAAGKVENTVVITGPPDVSTPDTSTVIINTDRYANLKVLKKQTTPEPLSVNQILQFEVTAINNGPDVATGVVVKDVLESMVGQPLTITTSKGLATFDPITKTITWQLPDMASGTQETLTFTAKLISGGTLSNTATIRGNETDLDLSDNTVTITQPVNGDDIFIPNIVTPNGDGKNDHFVIPGLDRYPGSSLMIYNRWGNQVYQNKNYDNKWDGNGLNEGTYYYILKLRTAQGERNYKGWIELLR